MKKFLAFFSYLCLLLPFFEMVKANEYKFLSGTSSGNTVTFSGITSDGVSTILNTYSGSGASISVNVGSGTYDEYNGKVLRLYYLVL